MPIGIPPQDAAFYLHFTRLAGAEFMNLNLESNIERVARRVDSVYAKQIPFATALALTRTALKARDAGKAEMARVFDRPTRWALNAYEVKPATKRDLDAEVRPKYKANYLPPEVLGGDRRRKRVEALLNGVASRDGSVRFTESDWVVPSREAKLDSYGNLSRGETQKALSGLKAQGDSAQNSKTSRGYFVTKGSHGKPVVMKRVGRNKISPVLVAVSKPNYKIRFKFFEITRKSAEENFENEFIAALKQAIASAR